MFNRHVVTTYFRAANARLPHVALILAGLALLLTFPGNSLGQTFRGTILGTVLDPNGAVVPSASVTAKNVGTGIERSVVSDEFGNYTIPELQTGTYEVRVEKPGFQSSTVTGVLVEVAAERRVDLTLPVAGSQEMVTIAATTQVETTSNTLGGTITSRKVAELPVNGRDFTKFLTMVPGATGDPSGATDSPGSFGLFSVNGNRGRANNFLLDGTDMNDGYRNLPAINEAGVFGTPATILPMDSLQEVSVINSTEAEFGRDSGATVNIVTKSGTNSLHGSAYEYFRNNGLDARNFFNPVGTPQNVFHNNQFGFSLGGPIRKDKTFWFVSYEGQREGVGIPTVATVPTQADINQAIADNGGVDNPVIAKLLARNPWGPLGTSESLITSDKANNRVDSVIAKIDHRFSENDLL